MLVKVELNFAILFGFRGQIVGRSGLANVHGIVAFNVTIDAYYSGTVSVIFLTFLILSMTLK